MPAYSAMMVDPLHAPLAQLPDKNDRATLMSRFHDVFDVTTTSTGHFLAVFGALTPLNYVSNTETSGAPNPLGPNTASTFQASINADSAGVRVLAFVVQWTPTLSVMNNSGRIFFGQYNTSSTGVGGLPIKAYASYFNDDGEAFTASKPAATIVRVSQEGNVFQDPNAISATLPVSPYVVVCFTGLPNSTLCGELTVTRITEAVPLGTTLSYSRAEKSICDMTDCCIAANIVGSDARSHGDEKSWEEVTAKANRIAKTALRLYTAYSTSGASELKNLIGG